MKVAFATLGCRVNFYESEAMAEKFIREGYEVVDFDTFADVYVINTCTVTNMGDKKSRQIISRARRSNPEAIIAAVGCYSQMSPKEVSAIEGVDVVLGTRNKGDVVYYVNKAKEEGQPQVHVEGVLKNKKFEDLKIEEYQDKTRAFLKIQDGCNAFCSYCIIPYVRGRVRSKDPEDVIKEVTTLVEKGYKEIVLTGIHTGRYGTDINTTLEELLNKLVNIPNIYRIRLSSIEINEITPGIKELLKENKVMAKHLHIPLQSGSNKILKLMNRRYNKEEFLSMVDNLRDIPDISLTTDLIVGFPNEDEEEFNETIDTLKKIGFTKIHTFPYSKRKGTPAATMDNQVSPEEKKKRVHRILDLSNKYEHNFYESKIGKIYDGVVEIHSNGTTIVHTSNFIPVIINDIVEEGTIVDVKIEKVEDLKVYGRIV